MKKIGFIITCGLLLLLTVCGSSQKETKITTIHISAAASLKDTIDEVKPLFEKEYPTIKLAFDFGGSGQIRERVESGAPIDGVLLASKKDTDTLLEQDLAEQAREFASNQLVLIEPKNANEVANQNLKQLLNHADKIAIGDPESVPAGAYAKQTLENLQLYDAEKAKLVLATDVRQVLSYVEAGNADAGFVYQTDALLSKKVQVSAKIDAKLHNPIAYYSAQVSNSEQKKAATTFLDFMNKQEAQKILGKYGFQSAN
ncbi:molybdate ABC transporter substrate-binding protein [Listeria ivanovii]|uniref:molybdate ABC transporter substrate-binding protein n=1 Tax=Listeria ivanovii TaxID=1638 RepID=UPI00190D3CD6|nr:molybdate ABC transporter substrate-binding protein [Listeria ivanovii]MBK3913165.1 molybdate ABC transporter substrate-binding protein [Listeria ivanovii subsp. ivanovii]MBK3920718.1 molybdate ABC transporter substrate-binding protein [Listeria ivanovii subsp. ivanovii]MBK3925456.1 molybdate ABC transporter substrate-binding protein [Listeria ivanovii subsp. ivanovii]